MIELQVLNTALLKEQALFDLMKYSPDIFSNHRHKTMYEIIEQLYSQGRKVDFPSLISEAKVQDLYDRIGGDSLLGEISKLPSVADHTLLLKNLEIERRKTHIKYAAQDFLKNKTTIDEFIDYVQPLFETEIDIDDGTDIGDYATQPLDDIFHEGLSVPTGLNKLDAEIGGLFRGDITLIAARPGEGKTTLALQIAKTIPDNVIFFSFEMKKSQILAKFINAITGIPIMSILKNRLNDADRKKVVEAIPIIAKYNLTVFDSSDNFIKVLSQMRKTIKKKNSKAIIVDYLQLIEGGKGNNPNERIGYISRQLKKLAMNEDIPMLALSQFSREVEKAEREPRLSDLRDSGCLHGDTRIFNYSHKSIDKIKMLDSSSKLDILSIREEKCEAIEMSKGFNSGVKEFYELETITGHKILATENHKFLTMEDGWKRLDELSESDMIAIPLSLNIKESKENRHLQEARFIAMMLANGCMLKNRSYQYTSNMLDEDLCDEIIVDSTSIMNGVISPYKKATYFKNRKSKWMNVFFPKNSDIIKSNKNPLTDYLKEIGLYNKRTKEKEIPGFVFYESEEFRKEFIKYLFSTDGTINIQTKHKTIVNISYSSASYDLITGLQFLLQSVGILSSLNTINQKSKDKVFTWYNLSIYSVYFQKKYLNEIGFAGNRKQAIQKEAIEIINKRYSGWTKYVLNNEKNIAYVEIKKIDKTGIIEDSYDLTVPETQNFIANGIIVHNSLEQDASTVLFIHDDSIIVGKCRLGRVGKISGFVHDKPRSRFIEQQPDFSNTKCFGYE